MKDKFYIAAKAKLLRRLNNLSPTNDSDIEIDNSYISCAEYQLFIDEKLKLGYHHQPDHWTQYRFPLGHAEKPITGVRASDAEAFCEWLNQVDSLGLFKYRLPSLTEAQDNQVIERQIGCWCQDRYRKIIAGIEFEQWQIWQDQIWQNNLNHLNYKTPSRARARARTRRFNNSLAGDIANIISKEFVSNNNLISALNKTRNRLFLSVGFRIYDNLVDLMSTLISSEFFYAANAFILTRDKERINEFIRTISMKVAHAIASNRDDAREQTLELTSDINRARKFLNKVTLTHIYNLIWTLNHTRERNLIYTHDLSLTSIRDYLLLISVLWYWLSELSREIYTKPKLFPFFRRWTRQNHENLIHKYLISTEEAFSLYAFFVLLDERRAGRMPAWEGIRIVRERKKS